MVVLVQERRRQQALRAHAVAGGLQPVLAGLVVQPVVGQVVEREAQEEHGEAAGQVVEREDLEPVPGRHRGRGDRADDRPLREQFDLLRPRPRLQLGQVEDHVVEVDRQEAQRQLPARPAHRVAVGVAPVVVVVGEAVVLHVDEAPHRERGVGGEERRRDPADPGVEPAIARRGVVAGVVRDGEQQVRRDRADERRHPPRPDVRQQRGGGAAPQGKPAHHQRHRRPRHGGHWLLRIWNAGDALEDGCFGGCGHSNSSVDDCAHMIRGFERPRKGRSARRHVRIAHQSCARTASGTVSARSSAA